MTEAITSYESVPDSDQNVIYYFGDGEPCNAYLTDSLNNVLSDWLIS